MAVMAMEADTVPFVGELDAGERIHARRQALGLTISALAERAGVDRGRLAKIEKGQVSSRDSTLGAIDRALDRLEEEMSGPYDPSEEHLVTFRMSGNFGVDVTVSGPVENLAELEESVGRLLQRMRNDNGGR